MKSKTRSVSETLNSREFKCSDLRGKSEILKTDVLRLLNFRATQI